MHKVIILTEPHGAWRGRHTNKTSKVLKAMHYKDLLSGLVQPNSGVSIYSMLATMDKF